MAIYHLNTHPIGRAAGHSAVAAAAYRSASNLVDKRTGEVFDFTRKGGVLSSEIVTPSGIPVPERAALWNTAEAAEKRKDARVAREWRAALPHELGEADRKALATHMGQTIADRYGVAVDVCIHAPDRKGDDRNFHVHMLATTRTLGPDGMLGAKAVIELANKDRQKAGITGTSQGDMIEIRQHWAELTNEALERAGIRARVDHRSLEAQGINREPTQHRGPAVSGLVRRGVDSEVARRMGEDANARLFAARELSKIERAIDRSILDLSADLGDAITERNEKQREALRAEREAEWSKGMERTGPAASPKKTARSDFESMTLEAQCEAWDVALNKMAEARRAKIARVQAKNRTRCERREQALRAVEATEPECPTKMLAFFRKKAYARAYSAFVAVRRVKSELEQQALRLSSRLEDAARENRAWAATVLRRAEPELAQRVEHHRVQELKARLEAEMREHQQRRQARKGRGMSR